MSKFWPLKTLSFKNDDNSKEGRIIESKFLIHAKWLYLKYHNELPLKDLLSTFQLKGLPIDEYILGHIELKGVVHTLAIFKLKKRSKFQNANFFDFFNTTGEYSSGKGKLDHIQLILSNNKFISNMKIVDGQLVDFKSFLVHLVRNNQLDLALEELNSNAPTKVITNEYSKLRNNLISLHSELFPSVSKGSFSFKDFDFPKEIIDWFSSSLSQSLVLIGPSGTGKTQGILALAHSHDLNPLLITEINDLKDFHPKNKLIIFDDFSDKDFHPEQLKHLLDSETPCRIRVLYNSIQIPANIRRIWISNNDLFSSVRGEDSRAIFRRVTQVFIQDSLISTPSLP